MYINNMTAKHLWHLCRLQLLKYRKGLNTSIVSITASSVIEYNNIFMIYNIGHVDTKRYIEALVCGINF